MQLDKSSPIIVSKEGKGKIHRRTRSASPIPAEPVESTLNAVQTVLNRRQLQVGMYMNGH